MPTRGQPPKPTNLRLLEQPTGVALRDNSRSAPKRGSTKGRNFVVAEPASPDEIPPPPDLLKEDGRGRAYWKVYWQHAASWLSWADYPTVTRLCELWDMYDDLKAGIMAQTEGHFYTESRRRGTTGKNVGHPMMPALRETSSLIERLETELGFTPVARSRIRLEEGAKGSALDEWQRKRGERKAAEEATRSSP